MEEIENHDCHKGPEDSCPICDNPDYLENYEDQTNREAGGVTT